MHAKSMENVKHPENSKGVYKIPKTQQKRIQNT